MSSPAAPVYEQTSDAFKKRFMWRLIIVLIGGMLLDGYILGVIGPVTPALAAELGLTSVQIGMVAAMALLGILIGSPVGGWAADKWGRKPLFMIDISLFVVASMISIQPVGVRRARAERRCSRNPLPVGVSAWMRPS